MDHLILPSKWSEINGAANLLAAWWEWGLNFFQPNTMSACYSNILIGEGSTNPLIHLRQCSVTTAQERMRKVVAGHMCSRSVLNMVSLLKQRHKSRTQWGQHNLYLPCGNFLAAPAGSVLVIPQNGPGSPGLQLQKLKSFYVTPTSG